MPQQLAVASKWQDLLRAVGLFIISTLSLGGRFLIIEPGQALDHYRLVDKLGEGGMGVVWKARDLVLDRDVALKILPDWLSDNVERSARFNREAKMLASLNHAHIATIHGFHTSGGISFIAMELVDGEDLSHRLRKGPMAIEDVIPTACQLAQALDCAHEKGIIHRDLKPSNLKFDSQGNLKVLDFGLAKALEIEEGHDSGTTATAQLTLPNVVLGTAPYMSPEQASGKPLDKRTDIWSFGVVLFEMMTGRRLFKGADKSAILAAVLTSEIEWGLLPTAAPAALRALVRRCLTRDVRHRLRDIGEARILLEDIGKGVRGDSSEEVARRAGVRPSIRATAILVSIGILIGAITTLIAHPKAKPVQLPVRRFLVAGPDSAGNPPSSPAISPTGNEIAYFQGGRLWIRDLSSFELRQVEIPGSKTDLPDYLFWSPDGRDVGYVLGSKVIKVSVTRGHSEAIIQSGNPCVSAVWDESGTVLYTAMDKMGLGPILSSDSESRTVLFPDTASGEAGFTYLSRLPKDAGVLFVAAGARFESLGLLSEEGRRTLLTLKGDNIHFPVYSPSGYIVFARGSWDKPHGIWAVPFSLSSLKVTGEPFLVLARATRPTIADDGTLLYLTVQTTNAWQLRWFDRSGEVIGRPSDADWQIQSRFEISPDGSRILIGQGEENSGDIFLMDAQMTVKTRLTFEGGRSRNPAWSRSGRQMVYLWHKETLKGYVLSRSIDRGDSPDTISAGSGMPSFSPDGGSVIASGPWVPNGEQDLYAFPLDKTGSRQLLAGGAGGQVFGRVSPTGRHLAYVSFDDRIKVHLTRFPSGTGRWQVPTPGGWSPRWNVHGDRLYYSFEGAIWELPISGDDSPILGTPRRLFSVPVLSQTDTVEFDVSPDEGRFLVLIPASQGQLTTVNCVQNWASEFVNQRK